MAERTLSEPNLAIFCDYENVAIGVRDAKHRTFDVGLVTQRLLDKGKIVLKKAYADWGRYKAALRPLHEAAFELIEIPHVTQSGKNSADIRLVVDALDLCYTKSHVDTFVIISGDSDFSPLVSKLRENDKRVIGLGVKNSTSDLLVENCDEFIYYDDLVRERRKTRSRKSRTGRDEGDPTEALEAVVSTAEALLRDRDTVFGSQIKQTLKRKRPNFSEAYYGYSSFNDLLKDAQHRQLLEVEKDERSGGYIVARLGPEA